MSDSTKRPKKKKRHLLRAVALSTGTLILGCGSQQSDPGQNAVPLPGNPKGSVYDQGQEQQQQQEQGQVPVPETGEGPDETAEGPEQAPHETAPEPRPVANMPANPKGALYDDGVYDERRPRRG